MEGTQSLALLTASRLHFKK